MSLRIYFSFAVSEHISLNAPSQTCISIQHLNVYYTCFDLGETNIYSLSLYLFYTKEIELLQEL